MQLRIIVAVMEGSMQVMDIIRLIMKAMKKE
jgi:hypothetical protein